jgi:molecular chaperone DnaK (HSP70)
VISKLLRSIIGRKMSEPRLHDDIRSLPYEIAERNNTPLIKVRGLWNEKLYTLEHVYSFVFQDLKRLAESRLNQSVHDVVVTVPTYFDDAPREAIENAAAMAGLDVIRLVRESRAAAIAYGYGFGTIDDDDPCSQRNDECMMVVYHQGETESYAAVMEYDYGVFETLGVVRENEVRPNG